MSLPVDEQRRLGRIPAIDIARGVALLAMVVYHFTWDLEFFGYAERGMTAVGGWKLFARCIASSFLFLVGVSLWLAHRNAVKWPAFRQRWLMVAGAAILISVGTWFVTPQAFIYFGILHEIAIASLLGLLFLRWRPLLILAIAILVIALPQFIQSEFFDPRYLAWIGFARDVPLSNDFVPVFPWFGAVLLGMGIAKIAEARGWLQRLQKAVQTSGGPLGWIGRHSLAFYLIHQPVLIGLLWTISQLVPPTILPPEVQFRNECERACSDSREAEFCARYCGCMLEKLRDGNQVTEELRNFCTMQSEPAGMGPEGQIEGEAP